MYKEIDSNKRKTIIFITVFLIFIIGLGWIFSRALGHFYILVIAVIFSILMSISSYWYSDKLVLAISHAHEIKKQENIDLYHVVENLCITAGLPMPKIYIIEDLSPNAFATGRDPNHAVICVTSGLLEKLNKTELEGVVAHELSHIGNYDIRLSMVIVILVGIVVLMSDWFLRLSFFGDSDSDSGELGIVFLIAGIILAILSPLFAMLIQLSVSRKREFLADASGTLLTRYPDGLANALEKISKDENALKVANKATAHLYITNPLKEHKGTRRGFFASLFDTHPPIDERIKRLREMTI
jgi:heat shock protein HtpX